MKTIIQNQDWYIEEINHDWKGIDLPSEYPNAIKILFEWIKWNIIELLRGEDWNFKASIIK